MAIHAQETIRARSVECRMRSPLFSSYRRVSPSSCYFLSSSQPLLGPGAFPVGGADGRVTLVGRRGGGAALEAEALDGGSGREGNGGAGITAALRSSMGISRVGVMAGGVSPADVGPANSGVFGRNRSSRVPMTSPAPTTRIVVAIKSTPRRVDRFAPRAV